MSKTNEVVSNGQDDTKQAEETTVTKTATEAQEVKKVNRRGVAAARGTQRLKFTHELAKPNGLFIAHLGSVDLTSITIGEDKTGMPSFNGLEIPRLALTFSSNEDDIIKRHFQTLSFTAVESNVNTIPGAKEGWKVDQVLDWVKHILNVFVFKGRELTDEEADALSLSFEDFDEQGEYVPVDPEDVIAGWKTFFENVENMLNRGNEGKPTFKTKDGKVVPLWIKLIRYTKNNKKGWQAVNNGDITFPTFVGEGAIEVFKQNLSPSIRVDSVKEAIHPMNIEKAKSPNLGNGIPAMDGMAPMGGFSGGPAYSNIATEAGDDVPF